MQRHKVPAFRDRNLLTIPDFFTREIREVLHRKLAVNRKVTTRSFGQLEVDYEYEPLFDYYYLEDIKREVFEMGYGLLDRVTEILEEFNCDVELFDESPMDHDEFLRMLPDQQAIDSLTLRENQVPFLADLISNANGQYVAPAGAGKSFLIESVCRIFPRANILVSTSNLGVLEQLWKNVALVNGLSAGIYSSRHNNASGRILFCSIGCLDHVIENEWDILMVDEKHECATLKKIRSILGIRARRAYAFSADHDDRTDQADDWLVSAFGEARQHLTHGQAVRSGEITPVHVHWYKVEDERFGNWNATHPSFERKAYWRHERRNELIAEIAQERAEQGQTLVFVKKVEHAYDLKMRLGCPVAHAVLKEADWIKLQRKGLAGKDDTPPTYDDLQRTREDFASGKIPLAICNSVWERGLNFPSLKTLIRADASTSMKDAKQVPGRLTRLHEGKDKADLIDFVDTYHDATYGRSHARRRNYESIGYRQHGWLDAS